MEHLGEPQGKIEEDLNQLGELPDSWEQLGEKLGRIEEDLEQLGELKDINEAETETSPLSSPDYHPRVGT